MERRKHRVGMRVKFQWVFGGIDVEYKEGFLVAVERTLLPFCESFRHIFGRERPGSLQHYWAIRLLASDGEPITQLYRFRHACYQQPRGVDVVEGQAE